MIVKANWKVEIKWGELLYVHPSKTASWLGYQKSRGYL